MNPYVDQLRESIVSAAVREHRSRRRRRAVLGIGAVLVVVAGVIALVVGLVVDPAQDTASAVEAVRATPSDAYTFVQIVQPDRPDQVLAKLQSSGFDATRFDRSTGPSRVGKVVSVVVEGNSRPVPATGDLMSAYVQQGAKVRIGVGIATPPGGLYDAATDAFAEGEPLHCRSWPGQPTAELAALVDEGDLNVRVIDDDSGPVDVLEPGRVVVAATAVAADRVIVKIADGPTDAMPAACRSAARTG